MESEKTLEILEQRAKLLGSFLLFVQVFYKLRTGRDFVISRPLSRESHYITIAKLLTRVLRFKSDSEALNEVLRIIIAVPPRYGKTELVIHFIAWALAHYPDSNFIYVSYSHTLAKKQTQTVREIIMLPEYKKLFCVELKGDASAKDNFETTDGGSVYAAGAGGTITGRGAGIQNCNRFGGAIIIDDIHKPSEVTSDTMRESVISWFTNTLQSRVNSPITPIIFIGQRLHEADLAACLLKGVDAHSWNLLSIKALDSVNNALLPAMHTTEMLLDMREKMPYEFAAQYQQDPQPAGGGIFKADWFVKVEEFEQLEILTTFITGDTAESVKDYADYTVFSFWGLHKIKLRGEETGLFGLHWIDCLQERIEPKDLESAFLNFWTNCMRYPVKPQIAAIEKKSTGSTLLSVLQKVQGLRLIEIDRNRRSGNKTNRFIKAQPYIASRQVSLPTHGKHTEMCIDHMRKITANESHRHDDIADTCADAIQLSLIDKVIYNTSENKEKEEFILKTFNQRLQERQNLRGKTLWHTR